MPTYKGIEMPTNNSDKIGAMIESAKNKLMGTPVGDFVRGVGAIADIPKTIVAGTQNSYGANIPTVAGLEKSLVTATPDATDLIKDAGTGVSRIVNNVNTPGIGAVTPAPSTAPSPATTPSIAPPVESTKPLYDMKAPLGAGESPVYGTSSQSFGALSKPEGSSVMTAQDLADWKDRGDKMDGIGAYKKAAENPNDALFLDLTKKLADIANTGPAIGRATNVAALKGAIDELAPQTSFGAFGVAGIHDETTKRGQDILSETTQRGQDITAETAAGLQGIYKDKNAMDALYQSGLLKQGQEKNDIEKMKADAKSPENFLKYLTMVSPKVKITDPATGAETETHDLAKGIKMLTDSGFETPKGFKTPSALEKPIITPEQAKAEMERRKAQKK